MGLQHAEPWLGLVELGNKIWCCLLRTSLELPREVTSKDLAWVAKGLPLGRQAGDEEWVGPATSWRPGPSDSRGQRKPIRSFE